MTSILYGQAMYCSECDLIFSNDHRGCPRCCNMNGVSMNSLRNCTQKKLGKLEERRGEVRSTNYNQLTLF